MNRTVALLGLTLALNLPLGYLRAGVKRFSVRWFVAVHFAIPVVAVARLLMGVDWRSSTLQLFVGAYALGQLVGGGYRGLQKRSG